MRTLLVLAAAAAMAQEPPNLALNDIGVIDAHVHVYTGGAALAEWLRTMDFRFVNVTVVDPYEGGAQTLTLQHKACAELSRVTGGRASWVSSFNPQDFEDSRFLARVNSEVEDTFLRGAVGVKIYKTIGMDLRSKDGKYVMPNDPRFAPLLEAIAARGKVLYAHIAEPILAWQPLDPADPNYGYYKNNPMWHISARPDRPSKEAILAARDRMLARHPKLRVIGCHLGSSEENVDEIASRLDRFPNFVVDTAARVPHLMAQPRDKVRAFLIKYQDRVLYATDFSILPGDNVPVKIQAWQGAIEAHWRYFSSAEIVSGVRGLDLPDAVLRKIFRGNAERWSLGNTVAGRH